MIKTILNSSLSQVFLLVKTFKIKKVKFYGEGAKTMIYFCFNYKMTTKQLNIKNRSYYFYNDLINVLNFEASNLKLDKKTFKDTDIYYVGYVDKKPDWNVNSVNPLYLIINRVYGSISEENGNKFLTIGKGQCCAKKVRSSLFWD